MLEGNLSFSSVVSTDLPKFAANPNQTYRAAILHYADENNQLLPIIRGCRQHWHNPEGGLKGFRCLSTDTQLAACCKHPNLFQVAAVRMVMPILVYASDFQGNMVPGVMPDLQLMSIGANPFEKLKTIDRTYTLASNDIAITGKKLQMGVALDFMPAGPAQWQQDPAMFAHFLAKAKALVEGPGMASIDRLLARTVTEQEVENAIRTASGGFGVPPVPTFAPIPFPLPLPATKNGPVSAEQIAALSDVLK